MLKVNIIDVSHNKNYEVVCFIKQTSSSLDISRCYLTNVDWKINDVEKSNVTVGEDGNLDSFLCGIGAGLSVEELEYA